MRLGCDIERVYSTLNLKDVQYSPSRVISIVSPSRSGSTIFKYALCLHPELCCLNGEEEPYYKLAGNGYPFHQSDRITELNDPDRVRYLIANEMANVGGKYNRRILQETLIEEPPFVDYQRCIPTDTLVLKTPQNCYRSGLIQKLYPKAKFEYIVVSREGRATVNGLLDGWASKDFTSRETPEGWWKFDMPPNWSFDDDVITRSKMQYTAAMKYIRNHYPNPVCRATYESFCTDWVSMIREVWSILGLPDYIPDSRLPELSTTMRPDPTRWMRLRPWLQEVELDAYC